MSPEPGSSRREVLAAIGRWVGLVVLGGIAFATRSRQRRTTSACETCLSRAICRGRPGAALSGKESGCLARMP